jgi:hypothetical protein
MTARADIVEVSGPGGGEGGGPGNFAARMIAADDNQAVRGQGR